MRMRKARQKVYKQEVTWEQIRRKKTLITYHIIDTSLIRVMCININNKLNVKVAAVNQPPVLPQPYIWTIHYTSEAQVSLLTRSLNCSFFLSVQWIMFYAYVISF